VRWTDRSALFVSCQPSPAIPCGLAGLCYVSTSMGVCVCMVSIAMCVCYVHVRILVSLVGAYGCLRQSSYPLLVVSCVFFAHPRSRSHVWFVCSCLLELFLTVLCIRRREVSLVSFLLRKTKPPARGVDSGWVDGSVLMQCTQACARHFGLGWAASVVVRCGGLAADTDGRTQTHQ